MSELQWFCDTCGQEIMDDDGHLTVEESAVWEAQRKMKDWKEAHPPGKQAPRAFTLGEIMEQPDLVPWHAYHAKCDPLPVSADYHISVSRIRNFRHALGWTLHLMADKPWIVYTDWDEFIRTRTGAELG